MANWKRSISITIATALGGCASGDVSAFPSLARRAIEQRAAVVPSSPASPAIPEPVSATLAEAIVGLGRDADGGNAVFTALLPPSRAPIQAGRGAAVGSEAWAQAEMALSRLEAARGPTVFALAELDRLALEQLEADNQAAADAFGVEQVRVAAMVAAQQQTLRSLTEP